MSPYSVGTHEYILLKIINGIFKWYSVRASLNLSAQIAIYFCAQVDEKSVICKNGIASSSVILLHPLVALNISDHVTRFILIHEELPYGNFLSLFPLTVSFSLSLSVSSRSLSLSFSLSLLLSFRCSSLFLSGINYFHLTTVFRDNIISCIRIAMYIIMPNILPNQIWQDRRPQVEKFFV